MHSRHKTPPKDLDRILRVCEKLKRWQERQSESDELLTVPAWIERWTFKRRHATAWKYHEFLTVDALESLLRAGYRAKHKLRQVE